METPPPRADGPAERDPDGTLPVREYALRDLRAGVPGYRHFQARLLDEISPAEAEDAERVCARGQRWLFRVVAAFLVLALSRELIDPFSSPDLYLTAGDVLFGSGVVAALLLSGTRVMPYAARVLFPLIAVFAVPPSLGAPVEHWTDWRPIAEVLAILAASGAVGWVVDATAPRRRLAPALGLPVVGLVLIGLQVARWAGLLGGQPGGVAGWSPPFPWATAAAGALLVAWPAMRRLVPRAGVATEDAATLLQAGWLRWRHLAFGRVMALVLGLPAFFLFLQNLGLPEALDPVDDARIARFDDQGESVRLFWYQEGRLLRESDLAERRFFHPGERELTHEFTRRLEAHPLDASLVEELLDYAAPRRVRYDPEAASAEDLYEPLLVDSFPLRPTLEWPTGEFHRARLLDFRALTPARPSWVGTDLREASISQWVLIAFGILGLIVLWRRGGDSPTARWLGIWLVGMAAIATYAYQRYSLPGLRFDLWERGLRSATGSALFRGVTLLESVVKALWAITWAGMAVWGLWTHLCWPTDYDPQRPPWWQAVVVTGKIAAVSAVGIGLSVFVITVTQYGGEALGWSDFGPTVGPFILILLLNGLVLGVGALLRRRTAAHSEVRRIGAIPILAYVTGQAVLVGILLYSFLARDHADVAEVAALWSRVAAVAFFALGALALLRHDFLRVSAGKDLSFVLLVLLLPVVLELAERAANLVLQQTGLFPAAALGVVSVFVVVVLITPLQRGIARLVRYLVVRRLRRIEGRVSAVIEELAGVETREALGARLADVFGELGVDGYCFYSRVADGAFELLVHGGSDKPVQRIECSEHLRGLMSRESAFLDLDVIPFEWPHFFHQFELGRLGRDTGARYLLPVCLKASVRGLLLLPRGDRQAELARDPIAGEINDLGIATVQATR